ncbi:Kinesin, putative [Hondaea fermentalgiana]|uniref:Kinesin-like protein n=1 Tax=Hondaea fermentalgiana TaxID=2315210 RepID=A0A2R5GSG4_9STRA|nr:Kinesin, putative [Hondaea fermentalgiana]|eukprot:GBG31311.1 Kinesin, putative [Hondaea fermentalgiana]
MSLAAEVDDVEGAATIEEENKNSSPVQAKKRKSDGQLAPTSARKILSEVNRGGSGLQAPGWSKSGNKQSKERRLTWKASNLKAIADRPQHTQQEELIEVPSENMDTIVARCFGSMDEREQQKAALLKRVKPEQKIFGYAKKFLETETKRLAQGLRDSFQTTDQLVEACKSYERTMLSSLESAKFRVEQLARAVDESKHKLAAAEKELSSVRKDESALRGEVQVIRKELKASTERGDEVAAHMGKLEARKTELEARVTQAENALAQKEAEAKELAKRIETHSVEMERLHNEHAGKVADLRAEKERIANELPGLRERIATLERERDAAAAETKEATQRLHQSEAEAQRLQASSVALQAQITNMESQVKQKDLHLDKTLETFQQNQTFSQDRIASLSEEKAKLEVRVHDLANAKSALEVDKTRLEGSLKEATDANAVLTTAKTDLQNELASVKDQASGAVSDLERAKRDAASATVRAEKCEAELSKRATATAKMEAAAEAMRTQLDEALAKNNALESEMEVLKKTYSEQGISSDERLEQLCEVSKEAALLKRQVGEFEKLQARLRETEAELKDTQNKLFESDKTRRRLHNEVQALKGKIRVVARVRPSAVGEDKEDEQQQLLCDVNGTTLAVQTERAQTSGTQVQSHKFEFDRVFAPQSAQADVFEEVSDFVQSALDGFNVCLFSYGQTGSGKTYTMTGDHNSPESRGIIPRAIDQIMSYQTELRSKGWEYTLEATYVEIYNESIRDLLTRSPGKTDSKPEIRDSKKEIILTNVNREPIDSKEQIHQVLELAQQNRSVAATDSNMHSSRSHSVFTLFITGVNKEFKAQVTGSLSMCDLAGSERIAKSNATGDRLKEAQAINKSLSSLANVFSSLQKKTAHVPYRNSKLTHMLQPCFAGEGKTMMIVNLSPESEHSNESLCSLRFAGGVQKTELGRAKKQISSMSS